MIGIIQDLVRSEIPGIESRLAELPKCECGGMTFLLFKIIGQSHWHLQCSECGQSSCFDPTGRGKSCADEMEEAK